MYNMIFGTQPYAAVLTSLLDTVRKTDFGRRRDAWVEIEGDWLAIRVHTRNGGGNRKDQAEAIESMRAHPWFDRDADMGFDPTYADFWFVPPHEVVLPEEFAGAEIDVIQFLSAVAQPPVDMPARWQEAIEQIGKPV